MPARCSVSTSATSVGTVHIRASVSTVPTTTRASSSGSMHPSGGGASSGESLTNTAERPDRKHESAAHDFDARFGTVQVTGDQRSTHELSGYPDSSSSAVTVNGVSGTRQSATVSGVADVGPPDGTRLVAYVFYGRIYKCYSNQAPAAPPRPMRWQTSIPWSPPPP